MALNVPYPNVPTDGQSLEASTLLANLNAIYQAIQQFDAAQIQAATLVAAAFNASINPNTILHDTISPFVQSGCVWSSVSGLNGTMSSGILYAPTPSSTILRVSVGGVGSHTFAASSDTYIDIDYNGNATYPAVANGASAPALTANSIRVAKVVTNGSVITAVTQSGSDSIGNIIYPNGSISAKQLQNPYKFRAYRATTSQTVTSGAFTKVQLNSETFDTGSNFDSTTNYRFTAPIAGFYQFNWAVGSASGSTSVLTELYVNGAGMSRGVWGYNGSSFIISTGADCIQLNANDYVELWAYLQGTSPQVTPGDYTYLSGFLVSET